MQRFSHSFIRIGLDGATDNDLKNLKKDWQVSKMKYLIFDYKAILSFVQSRKLQSIEYEEGLRLYKHICGELESEVFQNTIIKYTDEGIVFFGISNHTLSDKKIFCVDLQSCKILKEKDNLTDLLTIVQRILRTALKIWNKQPFSSSERVNKSLSIVFPFAIHDKRRIVIARSDLPRLDKRGIKFPLLAYKYSDEDYHMKEDDINTDILKTAGEKYSDLYGELSTEAKKSLDTDVNDIQTALKSVSSDPLDERDDFIYWNYEQKYNNLTKSQKDVVDYNNLNAPIRIEGAAGTGKTLSMLLRAYRILTDYKKRNAEFKIIFFSHNTSTLNKNHELFSLFEENNNSNFLDPSSKQHIEFTTLLDYCCNYANISIATVTDRDALDAKNYELLIIESILSTNKNKIKSYIPILSKEMSDIFSVVLNENNNLSIVCQMLHHEFSIQIKGRTDCSIEKYYEIPRITNGLPCNTKRDKDLVFTLFNEYQKFLQTYGNFDVNDVILEALSRLNGPVWRRERSSLGYDYIFVDEMHLFNVNEQSIFHYLTLSESDKKVPICFALDYNQAIGDHGDKSNDYVETSLENVKKSEYKTVFRNSTQIANFCASLAASGTLMFQSTFINPYTYTRTNFTDSEESKCNEPLLIMSNNDDEMLLELGKQIDRITKELQCKNNEIAVISFEYSIINKEGIDKLNKELGKKFSLITDENKDKNTILLASPYDINGLEFKAVILYGADEGRVPQSSKTTDISQHFLKYTAYNLLYLCSSRAKYQLVILGSDTKGVSSCLEYSISSKYIQYQSSNQ